jgi:hypothetical protein
MRSLRPERLNPLFQRFIATNARFVEPIPKSTEDPMNRRENGAGRAACASGLLIIRRQPRAARQWSVRRGQLLFVQALGHTRVPFAAYRPDHRGGIELATIDAHCAAEAAADIECGLDDGVAREARRDRLEMARWRMPLRFVDDSPLEGDGFGLAPPLRPPSAARIACTLAARMSCG